MELWYLKRVLRDHNGTKRMTSSADLQKLIDNMKRANSIVDRAKADAVKHDAIMTSFEQRLNLNDENMNKIQEYENLMVQMDNGSNGGPALNQTFPGNTTDAEGVTSNSTKGIGKLGT